MVKNTMLTEKCFTFVEQIFSSGKKEPSTNQTTLSPQKEFKSCIHLFYNQILSL